MKSLSETQAEIRSALQRNATSWNLENADLRVSSTAYGIPRIRFVHAGIATWSDELRRARLLGGIEDSTEIVAELLTPTEEEWAGNSFPDEIGAVPTWTEALSGPPTTEPLTFASDLDSDLARPSVVTFYSLRGGVGRTTALASVARILAARGRRVLCIDMDFEAPGLPYLFGLPSPEENQGALPLLLELEESPNPDVRDHIQRISDEYELYCMPAGRISAEYARRLRMVDPEIWYREELNPLHRLLDLVSESTIAPDLVLLDSRTGIAPISAPLLFDVSDLAVVCFFPHPQAELGTQLLVESLLRATSRRSTAGAVITPEPRFLISPVPPGPSAGQVRARASSWISSWLEPAQQRRAPAVGALRAEELTHFVSYSPDIAFRDTVADASTLNEGYGPAADWLEQLLPAPVDQTLPVESASKDQTLAELVFSTGTAEDQTSFFEDFVPTRTAKAALDHKIPLVIGRKGTGKTAIFRWLLENPADGGTATAVMCSNTFRNRFPWVLGNNGFEIIEQRLSEFGRGWPDFWAVYTPLATYLSMAGSNLPAPPERLSIPLASDLTVSLADLDELNVVDIITEALKIGECGLLASRWLRQIDGVLPIRRLLVFDGLDTGFGNSDNSRTRRTRAVTGLFTHMTEVESRLNRLSFKVLLRYDIWQQLRFENKSHLLGRSVQLVWRDQAEYFKTVLKQAIRSPAFRQLLSQAEIPANVDSWPDAEVFRAWNVLVGERMKGGNTTFTRNWVWNRLADGQGDHGPRALSQLFNSAVRWEVIEEARSPYDRSILRPRALVPSLEFVSGESLAALKEEFPELDRLIDCLEAVGRTPLTEADLEQLDPEAPEALDLALEAGLLAVSQSGSDDVRRFRVPELYRHALNVTRPGQA